MDRIQFGPKEHQTVPAVWAEKMLTMLYATNKAAFARLLQKVVREDDDEPGKE